MIGRNIPAGLGSPVFDKLEADLAKAMLSIPATKGFEVIRRSLSSYSYLQSSLLLFIRSDRDLVGLL